jgi:hypothetical protein
MKNLKIYVAARAKYSAGIVADIQSVLKANGHSITYDWAANSSLIKKPYRYPKNRKWNLKAQASMLKSAAEADVFILLDDEGLRGAYIELGAFLKDCLDHPGRRRVYIVGPDSYRREFIFESPEYVLFCDSIDEVYKDLGLKNLDGS